MATNEMKGNGGGELHFGDLVSSRDSRRQQTLEAHYGVRAIVDGKPEQFGSPKLPVVVFILRNRGS